jgi:uncharacterized iron-regulated membrane protein
MPMNWRVRRALYQVHLWVGVVLAAPLLLAALTGGLLLFKFDVVQLTVPGASQSVHLTTKQIGEAAEEIERIFGKSLRSLRLPDERIGVIEIYLADDNAAYFDTTTHSVVRRWNRHRDPLDLLFEIHHELLAGDVGRSLLGVVAIAGAILLLIGATLWLTPVRAFRVRLAAKTRPALLGTHRDLGVLIFIPLLLTLLSGIVLAYPNGSRAFLDAALPGSPLLERPLAASTGDIDWRSAVDATAAKFPTAEIRILVWPGKDGAAASIRVRQLEESHPNGRTTVFLDPATSTVLSVRDALAEPMGTRVANFAYPLHAATIGRSWWRFVLLASALGTLLVVSYGFIAWWKRS